MDKKMVAFAIILILVGGLGIPMLSYFFDDEYQAKNDPVEKTEYFSEDTSSYPSMLVADGQTITNSKNEQIVLKGVTSPDPHRLYQLDTFSLDYYTELLNFGGNVIRIPVNPSRYLQDEYYMWRFLDPIVKWAGENGKYVILDWDCEGNPVTGEGDNLADISNHVEEKTNDFWAQMAAHYKDTPNIVFEIYNEPEGVEAEKWAEITNGVISTIRTAGAKQLIIVSGIDECYNLSWVDEDTFTDDNIALSIHVFPNNEDYADVIGAYELDKPLIVTEWGYTGGDVASNMPVYGATADDFGTPFLELLNSKNISWVACYYDDTLEPAMFLKDSSDLSVFGQFVKEELNK